MSAREGDRTLAADDPVLDGLDEQQRAVALSIHGPVVVLAGAGTGKTRAITHRIAHAVRVGAHEPRRSMALTFTSRAAGQMRDRLSGLGVEGVAIRTFHAAGLRQLRHFWPRFSGGSPPELLPSKVRVLAEAAAACRLRLDGAGLRDLAADIEWAKNQQLEPRDLADTRRTLDRQWSSALDDVIRVYDAYDAIKSERNLLDFEDVLLVTAGVLQARPDIVDEVRAAYRWFTVDEYQDVNPLQHELLTLWRGERDEVCVVGDVNQTIYEFTGATPKYLVDFAREFPDATQVRLVNCYRCSGAIVDAANAVIADLSQRDVLQLRAVRPAGQQPSVSAFEDDVEEAQAVAGRIAALVQAGTRPRDIAVLFRVNAQSAEMEAACTDRGIPVVMRGAERFFERPEIREATTRLRGAARAGQATAAVPDEVRAVLATMGWELAPPSGGGATRERWESLSALAALADEHADLDIGTFVAELDRRAQAQHAPQADAVTLATLHAAKGLQWPVVFIIGCSQGLLPLQYGDTEIQVDQERRLCYVGMTRAADSLHLSWARARQPGSAPVRRRSQFLSALDGLASGHASSAADPASGSTSEAAVAGQVIRGTGVPRTERSRTGPAKCRICGKGLVTAPERTLARCRTCPSSADPALVERIRNWRQVRADQQGVPTYVICTDATALAIAELLPVSTEELAAIPGMDAAKVARDGPQLVALVREALTILDDR